MIKYIKDKGVKKFRYHLDLEIIKRKDPKHGKTNFFKMVKVSFVCQYLINKKYLKKVLDSIKKQKGEFDREYIFINDGSTDLSLQYLKNLPKMEK